MKKPVKLPEPLRYMQPFVNGLWKLSPDELNEDLDASALEAALRKRLRGLDDEAAAVALGKDRDLLQTWLDATAARGHPAYWVVGYLSSPDIAVHVLHPPQPGQGPVMTFEVPRGWAMKAVPFRLDLKKAKLLAEITAIDRETFDRHQLKHALASHPPGVQATARCCGVRFGECFGTKYIYVEAAPPSWKRVTYVLQVPGGYVSIWHSARGGTAFDEFELEEKLHTLRLSSPP